MGLKNYSQRKCSSSKGKETQIEIGFSKCSNHGLREDQSDSLEFRNKYFTLNSHRS